MTPRLLHQIWVGLNPMPEREVGFVEQMRVMHSDYTHTLWTDIQYPFGMPAAMLERYDSHYKEGKYAWCADILRIWAVYRYGGWYLDVDFEPIKRLDEFLPYTGMFCYHPNNLTDHTLVNGIFGMEPQHPLMKYCVDAIKAPEFWWGGPEWLGQQVRKFLQLPFDASQELVCINLLDRFGIVCYPWHDFDSKFAKHHALYSWK